MKECTRCGNEGFIFERAGDFAQTTPCPACQLCDPGCDGKGYTFSVNEAGYRIVKPCVCMEIKRRAEAFNRAMIPGRYTNVHFARIEVPPKCEDMMMARSQASRFAHEYTVGAEGLLLYGSTGTGKTLLSCCILQFLILQRGVSARFVEFGHLLTELRNCFREPGRARDVIEPLVSVPFLVIDELGKGRGSDWELSVLDDLISKRYNAERTTLLTTNYPIQQSAVFEGEEDLSERVGMRIYSRLVEMCRPVQLNGEDYRQSHPAN